MQNFNLITFVNTIKIVQGIKKLISRTVAMRTSLKKFNSDILNFVFYLHKKYNNLISIVEKNINVLIVKKLVKKFRPKNY